MIRETLEAERWGEIERWEVGVGYGFVRGGLYVVFCL